MTTRVIPASNAPRISGQHGDERPKEHPEATLEALTDLRGQKCDASFGGREHDFAAGDAGMLAGGGGVRAA
ncbi:MAG: hypothetical protein OEW35_20780 [Gammaproteobacteria bacterium]|nr:hypothetical protein [Gammaproteobacteria bacterium]MDH4255506.1 hypothetical protein [Gammaproteobacteria bacterium]